METTQIMKTFKNKNYIERNYECTNIVACQSPDRPGKEYELADESILIGLTKLWRTGDEVVYYGYL